MAKTSGPFIVIYGEEDVLLDRYIAARRTAWKDRQVSLLDGGATTEGKLITLCQTQSMFEDEGRAVVLDNAQDLKTTKAVAAYIEEKDQTSLSTILLVVVRAAKLPAVWAGAAKKGSLEVFPKFKSWETKEIINRINSEASALSLRLDAGIADLIYRNLGDDLRSTANELRKLSYIVEKDGVVKREHLALVLASNIEVEPKHVVEAALLKDKRLVVSRLSRIFKNEGDGACIPLVSSCLYQIEKILVTRQMLDRGDDLATIAIRFGMHEYSCKKNLLPLAQKHTTKALLGHMNNLCRLEVLVKGAARSKRTLVELAVLSIAV